MVFVSVVFQLTIWLIDGATVDTEPAIERYIELPPAQPTFSSTIYIQVLQIFNKWFIMSRNLNII